MVTIFDTDKVADLAKWSAAGFGMLTALLTFLGIQDGMLTRVFFEDPTAALWSFILIGLGVVLAFVALALHAATPARLLWVALAGLVVGGVTAALLKNIDATEVTTKLLWLTGALLALVVVALVLVPIKAPLPVVVLLVATISTSCGLYAAAKISVEVKSAPETMKVRVRLTGTGGTQSLQIALSGSKQSDGVVEVVASSTPMSTGRRPRPTVAGQVPQSRLWRSFFSADETRSVAESYDVPVDLSQWSTVSVQECVGVACAPKEVASFAGGAALHDGSIGGDLQPGSARKLLQAVVTGVHLLEGDRVIVQLRPAGRAQGNKGASSIAARILAARDGSVRWRARVPLDTSRWVLKAGVCGMRCSGADLATLATYGPGVAVRSSSASLKGRS